VAIEKIDILNIIEKLAGFNQPTICRHLVMLELLQLIEQKTGFADRELINLVSCAEDENIIAKVKELATEFSLLTESVCNDYHYERPTID